MEEDAASSDCYENSWTLYLPANYVANVKALLMVLTPLLLFATAIKRLMFVSVLLSFVLGEPETWHSIFQLSFMEPVGAKIQKKKVCRDLWHRSFATAHI